MRSSVSVHNYSLPTINALGSNLLKGFARDYVAEIFYSEVSKHVIQENDG